MSTAVMEDTETYLRIVCPSNRRPALQRHLHTTAEVIEDRVLTNENGEHFNVVVTRHPSEFLASNQSGRINDEMEFLADVCYSLPQAMEAPEFLSQRTSFSLPHLTDRSYGTTKTGFCGKYVESVGSTCVLRPEHHGNCRTKK